MLFYSLEQQQCVWQQSLKHVNFKDALIAINENISLTLNILYKKQKNKMKEGINQPWNKSQARHYIPHSVVTSAVRGTNSTGVLYMY